MQRVVIFLFSLLLSIVTQAQTQFSLYRLNSNLPQGNLVNPAFAPDHKVVIGLPVISSIYTAADADGITFRDVFVPGEGDSIRFDLENLPGKFKATQQMKVNEALQLFYFGLRAKRSYFSLGVHQVAEMRFHYPGDLAGWAISGPGHERYVGRPLDLGNFFFQGTAYGKASVNYARDITSRLRVGVRFNYLFGVAAAKSTDVNGTLTVNIDSVNINTGVMRFKTAGVDFFDQSNLGAKDYIDYLLKSKNKGQSWDIGATYRVGRNLTVSAAVNDLGYISWKEYVRTYEVNPVYYTFKGFDLATYANGNSDQVIDQEVDSLKNLYDPVEYTGGTLRTALVGKFYAGINYRVLRVNNFSALVYLDLFEKKIDPAVSLGYNLRLGRILDATIGITYQNKTIDNVGAGLVLRLGTLQIYAASDRANSFLYPARASRVDGITGINLVFGKPNKKKKGDSEDDEETEEEDKEDKKEKKRKRDKKEEETALAEEPHVTDTVTTERPAETTVATVMEGNNENISVESEQPGTVQPDSTIEQATGIAEPVVTEQPKEAEVQTVIAEQPKVVTEQPKEEIAAQTPNPDELSPGHYVVIGTFSTRENAQEYMRKLRNSGYECNMGYASSRKSYYVYAYKTADLFEARRVRDNVREITEFEFPETWVLTIEK